MGLLSKFKKSEEASREVPNPFGSPEPPVEEIVETVVAEDDSVPTIW